MKIRAAKFLDSALRMLCAALMGMMALTVILSVFFRYALSVTAVWSEELISVIFIASTFLGTAMVARDDEHIEINFIYDHLPPRGAAILRMLVSLVVIAVLAVVFKYSLGWIKVSGMLLTPGLEFPFKWLYSLLPVSCVLTCLVEAGKFVNRARVLFNAEAPK
jgi:TRAP-type C4-dicarboxylate transport system permease small subunit